MGKPQETQNSHLNTCYLESEITSPECKVTIKLITNHIDDVIFKYKFLMVQRKVYKDRRI